MTTEPALQPARAAGEPPRWSALHTDALLAGLLLFFLGFPSLLLLTAETPAPVAAFGVLVGLAVCGSMLVRRTHGLLALCVLSVLALVHVIMHAALFPIWFGVLLLLHSIGRFSSRSHKVIAMFVVLFDALLVGFWLEDEGSAAVFGESAVVVLWIPPFLLFATAIVIGWAIRKMIESNAAGRVAHEQQRVAQTAVRRADAEVERAALARDMHDVVAHSLAVVIAQANGARYTEEPAAKDAALASISDTARDALGDVRLLLAQLRHHQAPDPVASLTEIDALIRRMREAGLEVELERIGESHHLPRTADIAAYRIVQEALTNALRHGDRERRVHVRLRGVPLLDGTTGIVIDVHNRLLAEPGSAGHGVRGMHERARLAAGIAWTGVEDGWYRVHASFPAGLS